MRLINGDALMKAMYHRAFETDGDTMWQSGCWVRYRAIEQVVKDQPTIEERKTGKWIRCDTDGFGNMLKCSECGARIDIQEEFRSCFCYHCGTKMIGVEN